MFLGAIDDRARNVMVFEHKSGNAAVRANLDREKSAFYSVETMILPILSG